MATDSCASDRTEGMGAGSKRVWGWGGRVGLGFSLCDITVAVAHSNDGVDKVSATEALLVGVEMVSQRMEDDRVDGNWCTAQIHAAPGKLLVVESGEVEGEEDV